MKFSELELHPHLLSTLAKMNFSECTPIQSQAIPALLMGRDVAGLAQTGTGKTAAFLLPLIDRVLRGMEPTPAGEPNAPEHEGAKSLERQFTDWKKRQFILILVPTRELAEQVFTNAQQLLDGTSLSAVSVYGGTSYEVQKKAFADGVEFVIATPGRLIDLFKEHLVDLRQVRGVVFDEADRMFDMGFKDDMKFILKRIPRERQFLVFSATMNFDVLNTAYEFGADPVEINISKDQAKAENVKDELFHVGQSEKPMHLLSLIKKHKPRQIIVFSNFKRNVERIAVFLNRNNLPAMGISSLLTQAQRARVIAQFKAENESNILIATDLAARGLDILGVDMVINYDLPDDPENYVHRIGRTGRAGQTGRAFSLVSDRDVDALSRVETYLGHKVETGWLESSDLLKDFQAFPNEYEVDSQSQGPRSKKPQQRSGPDRGRPPARQQDRRPPRPARPQSADSQEKPQAGSGHHRDRQMGRHRQNARPAQEQQPQRGPQQRRDPKHAAPPQRQQNAPRVNRKPLERRPLNVTKKQPQGIVQKVSGFFKRLLGS